MEPSITENRFDSRVERLLMLIIEARQARQEAISDGKTSRS